jgi:hypothetical protein
MQWLNPAIETLGRLFGIIDKAVPDRTEANKMKLEIMKVTHGNPIIGIIMLLNFLLLAGMTIFDRDPPFWCLIAFIAYTTGPLLHGFSKEVINAIWDVAEVSIERREKLKQHKEEKE